MANLRVAELDFDTIKQNLKEFLQAQSEFTDYDFEGSGLSVLLDVLAYNTHYNAYLGNMLANEMFLDSAVKRSSAVSLAKHLGYTPRSTTASKAIVSVEVNNPTGSPTTLTIAKNTPFNINLDGAAFTFYNLEEITINRSDGTYIFPEVEVYEGQLLTQTFVVTNPGPNEKFIIPSNNVDTSTIRLTVQNSFTDATTSIYTLATDISGLSGESKVFFIEESPLEKYQIYFGDGTIGKKLSVGNIINIEYLVTSGSDANASNLISQSFTTTSIGGSSDVIVTTVTNPYGGGDKEDIDSIKFNAPMMNSAKNRAVTAEDYKSLISANFVDAESIAVWGGEENIPPSFGKIYISLKPFEGTQISQQAKEDLLINVLAPKKVLAVTPEFVDPEYYYVGLLVDVIYDSRLTTKSSSLIRQNVNDVIENYFQTSLQKFDKDFNKSLLIKSILDSDSSIVSVIIQIKLQKRTTVNLNSENSFISDSRIKFNNGVKPGSFYTTRFNVNLSNVETLTRIIDVPDTATPSDTGTGTLKLINVATGQTVNSNIGSINYGTGDVTVLAFTPTSLPNTITDLRFNSTIQESDHNLVVAKNEILILDDSTYNGVGGLETGLTINVSSS